MVDHDVLCVAGRVSGDGDDDAGGLAVDLGGVVLDEAVVAVVAEMVEFLVLVERAGVGHEGTDRVGALRGALHEGALSGRVVGQVAQPPRVVVVALARGIAAAHVCRAVVGHAVPPVESGGLPDAGCVGLSIPRRVSGRARESLGVHTGDRSGRAKTTTAPPTLGGAIESRACE